MLRRVTWSVLTRTVALFFALIPKRRRFRVAILAATALAPIAGAWLQGRAGRRNWCSAPYDEAMRLVMRVLADGRVAFDPDFVVDSDVALEPRAIYVTGHFPISAFFIRHAFDHGIVPVVVKAFPDIDAFIWGTREKYLAVNHSPAVLVRLRRRIEEGHPAMLLIDFDRGSSMPFESDHGSGHVATRIFEFAKRFAIPMFFLCVRSDRTGKPVVVTRALSPDPEEFITHLMEQADLVRRF